MAAFRIVKDRVMLAARHNHDGQENIGLAIRLRLQEGNNGELA
jgi:hypothetical protein